LAFECWDHRSEVRRCQSFSSSLFESSPESRRQSPRILIPGQCCTALSLSLCSLSSLSHPHPLSLTRWSRQVFEKKLEKEIKKERMAGKYDLGLLELGNSRIIKSPPPQLLHSDPAKNLQVSLHTIQVDRGLLWQEIEKVTHPALLYSAFVTPYLWSLFAQVRAESTLDHSMGMDELSAQKKRENGLTPRTSHRDRIVCPGYYQTKRGGSGAETYVIFAMEKSFNYQVPIPPSSPRLPHQASSELPRD
jgi:hypothetical protein